MTTTRTRTTTDQTYLTPPQLAKRLGVTSDKVHTWIRNGELTAIDVSARRGKRPRYRIAPNEIDRFLASRSTTPPRRPTTRRKRLAGIREYF